jgi:dihydroorotate dehydrogenase (fumarate)
MQDAGVAAVVLPSLFEEEADETVVPGEDSLPGLEFVGGGPVRYAKLTARAKEMLTIPVIASINGTTPSGWVSYAQQLEQAGADAIELNLYAVAADPWRSGARVEDGYLEVVRLVRGAVEVPLAVKLSPYLTATAHFCRRVVEAGADGLVLFNRFYQPDIDLDTLEVSPQVNLSDPVELRLPLRWLALLRPVLPAVSFAAMVDRGYGSVAELRGAAQHDRANDPVAYERANYLRTLASYRPHRMIR